MSLMIRISDNLGIPDDEVELNAIRATGPGGQNVNKVSSAIHLRFDVPNSSLPEMVKQRLLASRDGRITAEGVIVIKAQSHRTQEKNKADAISRLVGMVESATKVKRKRIPTRPGRAAKQRRLDHKKKRGSLKKLRGKV
jgi:ribosome-associated protein